MPKKPDTGLKCRFSDQLLAWHLHENRREMPWKGVRDPYKIWVSEIILQQTRVSQGLEYYKRFIEAFPNVQSLAHAPEEQVLKLWEGLGYYSRCRNLMVTARKIAGDHDGKFPADYDAILALKGIGPYTAAAISSFAFDLPHAVVDGNVFRVLARVFGVYEPSDSSKGKKVVTSLATELLDKDRPGIYNQAIMDFGATICKPVNPLCGQCVFRNECHAYLANKVDELPVKTKKIKIRKRWFNYMIMHHDGKVAIRKRTGNDIWRDLWEFPLIETNNDAEVAMLLEEAESKYGLEKNTYRVAEVKRGRQQLSHQLINGQFMSILLNDKPEKEDKWKWVAFDELHREPFPVLINSYIQSGDEQ